MFKKEKEEVIHLQAHFKKNQKIREYSSHISKVHSVDWSADGSKFNLEVSRSPGKVLIMLKIKKFSKPFQ